MVVCTCRKYLQGMYRIAVDCPLMSKAMIELVNLAGATKRISKEIQSNQREFQKKFAMNFKRNLQLEFKQCLLNFKEIQQAMQVGALPELKLVVDWNEL